MGVVTHWLGQALHLGGKLVEPFALVKLLTAWLAHSARRRETVLTGAWHPYP